MVGEKSKENFQRFYMTEEEEKNKIIQEAALVFGLSRSTILRKLKELNKSSLSEKTFEIKVTKFLTFQKIRSTSHN